MEDLGAAHKLAADPNPYPRIAIYHCQQAAEKAVKAYFVSQDKPFDKIHDVRALVIQAAIHDQSFKTQLVAAVRLTPYATQFRYPDSGLLPKPSLAEVRTALADAQQIYDFVLSLLPPEVHP